MPGPPIVAVIVVFEDVEDTIACLRALRASQGADVRPVVVDNGSRWDIRAALGGVLDGATFVRATENRGYAAGVNLGLRIGFAAYRDANIAVVLNNDVLVAPTCLALLAGVLRRDAGLGAVSPRLVESDGGGVWFDGGWFDWKRGVPRGPRFGPRRFCGSAPIAEAEIASGACLALSRAALERVGPWDESYFLYYEETDFCRRLRQAGFRIAVARDARASHRVSRSIGHRSRLWLYYVTRSNLAFMARYAPRSVWPIFLVWLTRRCLAELRGGSVGERLSRLEAIAWAGIDFLSRRRGHQRPRLGP